MKNDKVFSEYLESRKYLDRKLRWEKLSRGWYKKDSEELDRIGDRIQELEKKIVILDHNLFTTHKVFVKSRSIWNQVFKSHLADKRNRVLKKKNIPYLRKIYCVYRLYKGYHLSVQQIAYILGLDITGKGKYRRLTMVRSIIGDAFKRDCMRDSCFAKPFFENPDYIPPSLVGNNNEK